MTTPTDADEVNSEREALADLIAEERDKWPRVSDDMDSEELADVILAAGFRRSEVPEPSAEWTTRSVVLREESMYLRERISDAESARDEHPKDSQAWRALNEPLNAMRREANRLSLRADEFAEVPEPSAERLDYYDPARQDRISEHDGVFEDGEWWFGHGMPCKHPKLHAEPQGEPSDDYEAGYAEGFHHGVSSPRGSARDDRVDGEPSDASVRAALREWFRGIIAGGWTAEHEARMRAALRAAQEVR